MINLADPVQILRQMQLQKTIGELNALTMMYYDPMTNINLDYRKIKEMVEQFEKELKENFG